MQQGTYEEDLTPVQKSGQSQTRSGGSKFNQIKSTVAEKLHTAAAAIRQKSAQNDNAAKYAYQASDALDQAADYVRDIEPAQIKADLQQQVRSNPGRSLLIASAAGLALGLLLRRR